MAKTLKLVLAAITAACILISNSTVFAAKTEETLPSVEGSDVSAEDHVLIPTPTLTTAHISYITGFPGGTFLPDKLLTRAQAAQIVYRLLSDQTRGALPCSYEDIAETDWYFKPVTVLCSLGLLDDGAAFRPTKEMTRAEFLDLLTRFVPLTQGEGAFSDVPADYWAAQQVETAAALGWINGYENGAFYPDNFLTRAQACAIINRMAGRTGDYNLGKWLVGMGLYSDVTTAQWAWLEIVEASMDHTPAFSDKGESWDNWNLEGHKFLPGFHEVNGALYYADRDGRLLRNTTLGAYWADKTGALTLVSSAFQIQNVPYISQIDNIFAWVGCEPVSALMGIKAKGFAGTVTVKEFLDALPLTASNPAKGFAGSPYVPDPTKKTRTTIYPPILSEYCNFYCGGENLCADFSGATVNQLQRELLAGNCVVAYMTMWWEKPFYRKYNIEGEIQWLVSNNHVVLVCGYDPNKGYLISDPYNYYNRNQINQYWANAPTFDGIWNERQVGMVLR